MALPNLFESLPSSISQEFIEVLAENPGVRIERIVSVGHSSPEGFWYDQEEWEWVILLKGEAMMLLEGDHEPICMRPGDHMTLAAHRRHRVEWTTPAEPTVWLAVFFGV